MSDTPNDIAIAANTSLHDLRPLTAQETSLVGGISMGMSVTAAAKRAGMGVQKAKTILNEPSVKEHLAVLSQDRMELMRDQIKYDTVDAHLDIEMGKRMSANAMEWFRGVEMHMKLHGLGIEKKELEVTVTNIQKVDQLAEMDDAQLLELIGKKDNALTPQGHIEDAEYTEVDD